MLPTEQTKLRTAISGPDENVLDRGHERRRVLDEQPVEEVVSEQADEAGEQEAERDLLPEHLPVAAEVVGDVRPGGGRAQPLPPAHPLAGGVMLVTAVRALRVLARPLLQLRRDEKAQRQRHQHDHQRPADVLGEGELPADQHPEHQPQLPDQVGRGELEAERGHRRGALLKQRLGDRDRRVGAGGAGGPEPGGQGDLLRALAGERALDPLPRDPGLDHARDRETEDERPPDLIRHQQRLLDAVEDRSRDVAHRGIIPRGGINHQRDGGR